MIRLLKKVLRGRKLANLVNTGAGADLKRGFSGTWSNPDKTKTLPFILGKTEEFNLEDYLVKDSSLALELKGWCEAYSEKKCYLVDKKTQKVLIEDFAKIDQFSNCGGGSGFDRCSWMVSLGKKDNEGQYILFKFPSAGFYALNFPGLGTLGERFTISKYNFKSQKLEKVETEHYQYIYIYDVNMNTNI